MSWTEIGLQIGITVVNGNSLTLTGSLGFSESRASLIIGVQLILENTVLVDALVDDGIVLIVLGLEIKGRRGSALFLDCTFVDLGLLDLFLGHGNLHVALVDH